MYKVTEVIKRVNNDIFGFILQDEKGKIMPIVAKDLEKYIGKEEAYNMYKSKGKAYSVIMKRGDIYVLQNKIKEERVEYPSEVLIVLLKLGSIVVDNVYLRESKTGAITIVQKAGEKIEKVEEPSKVSGKYEEHKQAVQKAVNEHNPEKEVIIGTQDDTMKDIVKFNNYFKAILKFKTVVGENLYNKVCVKEQGLAVKIEVEGTDKINMVIDAERNKIENIKEENYKLTEKERERLKRGIAEFHKYREGMDSELVLRLGTSNGKISVFTDHLGRYCRIFGISFTEYKRVQAIAEAFMTDLQNGKMQGLIKAIRGKEGIEKGISVITQIVESGYRIEPEGTNVYRLTSINKDVEVQKKFDIVLTALEELMANYVVINKHKVAPLPIEGTLNINKAEDKTTFKVAVVKGVAPNIRGIIEYWKKEGEVPWADDALHAIMHKYGDEIVGYDMTKYLSVSNGESVKVTEKQLCRLFSVEWKLYNKRGYQPIAVESTALETYKLYRAVSDGSNTGKEVYQDIIKQWMSKMTKTESPIKTPLVKYLNDNIDTYENWKDKRGMEDDIEDDNGEVKLVLFNYAKQ